MNELDVSRQQHKVHRHIFTGGLHLPVCCEWRREVRLGISVAIKSKGNTEKKNLDVEY